jgi:hypothetical protein
MRLTRQQIVPWVIVVAILGGSAVAILHPLTFLRRGRYRGEVRALFDDLQLDMNREQVRRVMDPGKYPHLDFREVEDAMWLASAPYEFGAQSWVLVVEFQDNRLTALRVRTHDGFKDFQRPAEAPADSVGPSVGR